MTRKERVIAALNFEEVDRVPHEFGFTQEAEEKLRGHFGDDFPACLGNHFTAADPGPPRAWEEIEPGIWRDEWGVEWDRTVDRDIGTPRNCLMPEADMKYFSPPEIGEERFAHIPERIEQGEDTFVVAGIGFSLYERAWTLRGLSNFLMDIAAEPGFAGELLEAIADWNLEIVDRLVEIPGIDCIHFGDDWGSQRGLITGPGAWRTLIRPNLKRMYSRVKEAGKYLSIHSCGMVQELFEDLVEMGLDLFNPFQPEVMDVHEMHARYYGRLAFWGGISTQHTLPYGSPEDVRAEVRDRIEMGRRGGYVLAPAHATPRDVPLENMLAMIETVQQQ